MLAKRRDGPFGLSIFLGISWGMTAVFVFKYLQARHETSNMHLTADYLISDCGCPRLLISPVTYQPNNSIPISKLRFHNYITASRRRLLPKRESLSDFYDKLLTNSVAVNEPAFMQSHMTKHIKCAANETIRNADKTSHISRNQ